MKQFTRQCEWCDVEFATEWETKLYCSRQHKESAHLHRKRVRNATPRPQYPRICKGCATDFTTGNARKLYCSDLCREWHKQQVKKDRDRAWENQRKGSMRARVYLAHSGICGICHTHIDGTLKYPDPMSLSIDHIIPRSKQGTHKMDNLQPAHNICNSTRQAKPLT